MHNTENAIKIGQHYDREYIVTIDPLCTHARKQ